MNIIPLVTLIGGTPHGPQVFLPGQVVTLNTEEAKRLMDSQLVVASHHDSPVSEAADFIDAIVDAIAELPSSGFAKDGKPNIKALQNILECEVSATQRDEAWEQFQQLSQSSPVNTPKGA